MTEMVSRRFGDFDQWSTRDMVDAMYEGQLAAMAAVKPVIDELAITAEEAAKRLSGQGRLVYVGAGTSGRLAVQDGAELGPTFGWPHDRLVFCMAGGMKALTMSSERAEDISTDGHEQIRTANLGKEDVVIGVAASGRTPFTLGALSEAKARGALTIGVVNNPGSPIAAEVDHTLLAQTGCELIAGSTRMKAGTSQKVILNMLSTAIMTRLGRVYKGFMVDMIVSNQKLEERAVGMICQIAGCDSAVAKSALKKANLNIKCAVLMALGASQAQSERLLIEADGNLRQALSLGNYG
ncbi:MAG: N-acetylmuramic acid 6-phosphate etherase [Robiginitomaculum sp.]|nr:N-acetylmuramic acid 6-phosphate etherase [Robiginitomaculum sp.]MDQ7078647.1 N-acetylmuramic acid 6-phosphate etherase [Robiginitomaculum sp.]